MMSAPDRPTDPFGWCAVISLAFLALVLHRIGLPSQLYFDEVHYVPAARALLEGGDWLNREHPPLGKELIALGIALLGDGPLGWRMPSALAGAATLFAAMRALWFASERREATLVYGVLLASGGFLFVQARIAMLDGFMMCFLMVALWQLAAAVRQPEGGRWRLALAGVMLGLALASKWNAVLVAALPGLAFLAARLAAGRRRLLLSRRGIPVPGVSLLEAGIWLGAVPLLVYWACFLPVALAAGEPFGPLAMIELHREISALQQSVKEPHPYQSVWWQWPLNLRPIWYFYDWSDGALRGVFLLGNPLTTLLGLPALGWCLWAGLRHKRWDALAVAALYLTALGLWWIAPKPVQFYYHYFLPHCFALAALALALDALCSTRWRKLALIVPLASVALFAGFYPVYSAAPLASDFAFERWMWLDSWR